MTAHLGAAVIELLEQAGEHLLGESAPDVYSAFLLQVGGANTLRRYEASSTYWDCVQAMLDTFFTAAERAEICARLISHGELRCRPEFQGFLAHALAERRLQEMIAAAACAHPVIGPASLPGRRHR
jgi:hypothetical protein